jgi:hypothetical protein
MAAISMKPDLAEIFIKALLERLGNDIEKFIAFMFSIINDSPKVFDESYNAICMMGNMKKDYGMKGKSMIHCSHAFMYGFLEEVIGAWAKKEKLDFKFSLNKH